MLSKRNLLFVYSLVEAKGKAQVDYDHVIGSFQSYFTIPNQYGLTAKASTLFRTDKEAVLIEDIGMNGDILRKKRKYPLDHNLQNPDSISYVVDAYLDREVKVFIKEKKRFGFQKEYIICYPMAERFIATIHLTGKLDAGREKVVFDHIDELNAELIGTLHTFLEGEISYDEKIQDGI